jgi:hypothetical protein
MNKKILLIGYSYWVKIIANQSNNIKCIEFVGIQDNNPSALKEFTKHFPKKKYFLKFCKKICQKLYLNPRVPNAKKVNC